MANIGEVQSQALVTQEQSTQMPHQNHSIDLDGQSHLVEAADHHHLASFNSSRGRAPSQVSAHKTDLVRATLKERIMRSKVGRYARLWAARFNLCRENKYSVWLAPAILGDFLGQDARHAALSARNWLRGGDKVRQ